MLRVDQAGEYGATRIYAGQLAVMGDHVPAARAIARMAAQEERHRLRFDALMAERGVRPTLLHPAWRVAGFALGAVTALMSPEAAMACTAAIETEIDRHYGAQLDAIGNSGPGAGRRDHRVPRRRDRAIARRRSPRARARRTGPCWKARSASVPGGDRLVAAPVTSRKEARRAHSTAAATRGLFMKRLTGVVLALLCATGFGTPASAQSERTLIIYGTDRCPTSNGEEIVVCVRRSENDRYRIPPELRKSDPLYNKRWADRAQSLEYVGASGRAELLAGRLGRAHRAASTSSCATRRRSAAIWARSRRSRSSCRNVQPPAKAVHGQATARTIGPLMRKLIPAIALVSVIIAFPVAAAPPTDSLKESATPPERVISIMVYGNDPCPRSSGDEIVVCARQPESERFRIPKRFRDKKQEAAGRSWGDRAATLEYVAGAGTPNSCSVVGSGGQTGCMQQFLRQAREERRQARSDAAQIP